jgi:hypothetical protein
MIMTFCTALWEMIMTFGAALWQMIMTFRAALWEMIRLLILVPSNHMIGLWVVV